MARLYYGQKPYLYQGKISLKDVSAFILNTFGLKKGQFTLLYVDQDNDNIPLETRDDYEMVSSVLLESLELKLIVVPNKHPIVSLSTPGNANISQKEEQLNKNGFNYNSLEKENEHKIKEKQKHEKELVQISKKTEQQGINKLDSKQIQKLEPYKIQQLKIFQKENTISIIKKESTNQMRKTQEKINMMCESKLDSNQSGGTKIQIQTNTKELNYEESDAQQITQGEIKELDAVQLDEIISRRVKSMIPAIKRQLNSQIQRQSRLEDNYQILGNQLYRVGLEYPTTIDDIVKMKGNAIQKINDFYRAQHAKINQKLKQEKIKIALHKQRKTSEIIIQGNTKDTNS